MSAVPIIPTDSPSIYDQLTTLDRAAIVRPNNPPPGIAGFLFDIDLEQFMELLSEITDNAIEDNTMLQDNIALLPERVTVRGIVAELATAATRFPTPAPPPAPLPLFPPLFPPFAIGANLTFGRRFGAFGLSTDLSVARGADGNLTGAASVNGAIGPFSAGSIIRTVSDQLAGVIAVSDPVLAAIAAAVNGAVNSLSAGNAPSSAAIAAAINNSVGNVIGTDLTPDVSALIVQSVNSSLSTTSGANPGPLASASSTLYEYYQNRAPIQPGQTAQGRAVGYLYQMWRARGMFSVETPWGIINDMAILSVRPEQPEDSKGATTFSITFKKIRIAKSVSVNLGQLAGRNAFQASASAPAQNGNAGQTPATPAQETSWLATLTGSGNP